jgi:hypothetical protein
VLLPVLFEAEQSLCGISENYIGACAFFPFLRKTGMRGRGRVVSLIHTYIPLTLYPQGVSKELDGLAVSALRHAMAEYKQRWSVIGWVTKNLLSRAPPCFGRHVKPLVLAAFAVICTNQTSPRGGLWRVLLMCNP